LHLIIIYLFRYLKDYKSTTLQAIKHSTRPLETSKERADFIASSGIAAYRMTYRYVHMLQRIKSVSSAHNEQNNLEGIGNSLSK